MLTRLPTLLCTFAALILPLLAAPLAAADLPPAGAAAAPTLLLYHEFVRCDHTGQPIAADTKDPALLKPIDTAKPIKLPRGGYASFHLLVANLGEGYCLSAKTIDLPPNAGGQIPPQIQVDLYTEWYHGFGKDKAKPDSVIPDGLVPYKGDRFAVPHPDMKIPGQTVQAFWVDLWVPADAPTGTQTVTLNLVQDDGKAARVIWKTVGSLPITLDIQAAVIPKEDAVTADHNCYGVGFVGNSVQPWPEVITKDKPFRFSPEYYATIHAHHRLAFDNRCTFHQLGTNHVGGFSPEFNPETAGEARNLKITSWEKFDGHYGPLLDGTAMKGCRRATTYEARPIPFVYTAITPEWPSPFLHWGTPAYEFEFTKIVRAMHDHFAEKGWTRTNFELFFNHKMRYKGFPWDGDETRFDSDEAYFKEYARLLTASLPMPEKPAEKTRDKFVSKNGVRFVFRADFSWNINRQITELNGVINYFVMSGGCITFYPKAFAESKSRGDVVWFYGGTPSIPAAAASMVEYPARAFLIGFEGYCRWNCTSNGGDPWNNSDGAGELLYYPGGARGFHEPLPCIRLKLERNALQDVALLKACEAKAGGHDAFAKKILALASLTPDCFWKPDSPLVKKPIIEWNNPDIGDNAALGLSENKNLDLAAWWLQVRALCLDLK